MSMIYCTTVNDDILAWSLEVATILILTRLYADSIITYVELAVHDESILTCFEVDTIAILAIPWVDDHHVVDDDILTHEWMKVPCWRVLETYTFKKHILAIVEVEKHWTEIVADLLPVFLCLYATNHIHVGASVCIANCLCREPDIALFVYATSTIASQFC